MAFYNSVNAGDKFKPSVQLSNDVRGMLNRLNGMSEKAIDSNSVQVTKISVYNPGTALLYVNMAVEIDTFAPVYGETYPVKMSLNGSGAVGVLTQPLASGQCGSMVTSGVVQVPVFGGTIKPYVRIENGGFWYDDRPDIPVMYGTTEWASINLGSAPAQSVADIAYFWELKTNAVTDEQTGTTQYYLYINNPDKCYVQAFGERVSLVGAEALPIVAAEGYTGTIYLRWGAGKPELVVYVGDVPANCLHPCLELGLLNWNNGMPAITQTYVTTNSDIALTPYQSHYLAKPIANGMIEICKIKADYGYATTDENFGYIPAMTIIETEAIGKKLYAHLPQTAVADFVLSPEFVRDNTTDVYIYIGVIGQDIGYYDRTARFTERGYIDELA